MLTTGQFKRKELLSMMNITENQWKRRKEEILALLEDSCSFEIHTGGLNNCLTFIIKEVYNDNPVLSSKAIITREEKLKDYEKFTLEELPKHPLNSIANLARNAVEDKKLKEKYAHRERTAMNYIRPVMKSDKVSAKQKYWARLEGNSYIPLNKDEEQFLRQCFQDCMSVKEEYELMAMYENGDVEKETIKEALFKKVKGSYDNAMNKFIEEYGFRPIKVTYWEVK